MTTPNWCPGCGNFGIWAAFKNACTQNDWNKQNTVMVAGIGCHGHIVNFVDMTFFEGLHGRALPVATGVKIANHKLNVFVFTGDGDCLGEGGNHFIHSCRRNHDLTILLHNNGVYGLTKGQPAPDFNPVALAIISGATFVARAYSTNIPYLTQLIKQANDHQGLAVIDILQPCVIFNKEYTHQFYQNNSYYLDETYDPTNKIAALEKSLEWVPGKIPLGIIYKENKPSYESQIKEPAPCKKRDISDILK
ncbi:MAG: thiamine pyrophosphate-dependent enzyme [Patescibacteria group bacterium]